MSAPSDDAPLHLPDCQSNLYGTSLGGCSCQRRKALADPLSDWEVAYMEEQRIAASRRGWCPKMLRERLCQQQTFAPDDFTRKEIGRLIHVLDLHRPLGSNGKHGDLHTPTCGCDA